MARIRIYSMTQNRLVLIACLWMLSATVSAYVTPHEKIVTTFVNFTGQGEVLNSSFTNNDLSEELNTFERDIKRKFNKLSAQYNCSNYTAWEIGQSDRYAVVENVACIYFGSCQTKEVGLHCKKVHCKMQINHDPITTPAFVEARSLKAVEIYINYMIGNDYSWFKNTKYLGPFSKTAKLDLEFSGSHQYIMNTDEIAGFEKVFSQFISRSENEFTPSITIRETNLVDQTIFIKYDSDAVAHNHLLKNEYDVIQISTEVHIFSLNEPQTDVEYIMKNYVENEKDVLLQMLKNSNVGYFEEIIDVKNSFTSVEESREKIVTKIKKEDLALVFCMVSIFFGIIGLTILYVTTRKMSSKRENDKEKKESSITNSSISVTLSFQSHESTGDAIM